MQNIDNISPKDCQMSLVEALSWCKIYQEMKTAPTLEPYGMFL